MITVSAIAVNYSRDHWGRRIVDASSLPNSGSSVHPNDLAKPPSDVQLPTSVWSGPAAGDARIEGVRPCLLGKKYFATCLVAKVEPL